MDLATLGGEDFLKILQSAYKNLNANFQAINDLNVFPVPDGDTGTNMRLTFAKGLSYVNDTSRIDVVASSLASGMLFGARGNSGVLTSQYFKGLSDGLKGKQTATVEEFASAMVTAYKTAYKATVVPTEGTILTVAREGIENIYPKPKNSGSFLNFLTSVCQAMRVSLDNTPNLLPILKQSGVIDSGGKGLLTIFEGMLLYFNEDYKSVEAFDISTPSHEHGDLLPKIDYSAFNENSVLDYGYCTEFLLQLLTSKIDVNSFEIAPFIDYLSAHGDSLVCFQTGTIVKVHIHTKKPYEVIEFAQKYGEFISFKMENMALQHNEVVSKKKDKEKTKKKWAVISIAQGDGLIKLFEELGSDIVLNGGQTMNTSAAEMIDAIKQANAEKIIILPDNPNIILAAKQAAELSKDSKVTVIPTKSIQEGYSALTMLVDHNSPYEEAYDSLKDGASSIISCFIARTSRDATVSGNIAPKGAYVGGTGKELLTWSANRKEALEGLIEKVQDIKEKQILYLFYGQQVSQKEAEDAASKIADKYPNLEVGAISGKQDIYDYLIGIC